MSETETAGFGSGDTRPALPAVRPHRSFAETVWIDVLLSVAFILENTWCSSLLPVAVTKKLTESNLEMKGCV